MVEIGRSAEKLQSSALQVEMCGRGSFFLARCYGVNNFGVNNYGVNNDSVNNCGVNNGARTVG